VISWFISVVRAAIFGLWFVLFWLGGLALSWLLLPLARLGSRHLPENERMLLCRDLVGKACSLFHFGMRVTGAFVWKPRSLTLALPSQPFVMIANHPTLVDVTALMALHPRICCVAKTALFRSLAMGPTLRYCGHLEGGDGTVMEGATVISGALDRLASGQSLLVFPEGTRSPRWAIGPMRRGAFEVAIRANAPIVPLLMTCDTATLMKGMPWYTLPRTTARLSATQLEIVGPEAFGTSSRHLAGRFRSMYVQRLEAWRSARPEPHPRPAAAFLESPAWKNSSSN